ncbi:MAG TPA: class I SAM-dependent methyltransferase [Gemmatimonadales bacterium]|nr:class I SAM-dependent methyltransferase [Gemmatimonadales bacterium]
MGLFRHLLGHSIFPPRYAWFLEGPWRRLVLSPQRLERRLALSPQLTVLEIGTGGGYYARPLSALVHRLIAVDLQAEMLHRLQSKATSPLLLPVRADATHLPLAGSSIDVVLAVTVLGEVPSVQRTIAEVRRVLRPGGVLSVSEHWPDPDFLAFSLVNELCRESGFQLITRYGARFSYTANFRTNAA